jgi:hypothetical protein
MDNQRPSRVLRRKVEDRWLGRSGSGMWKADTSKFVAPPVSDKDRWVGPREQILNVPITYFYMSLVNLVACHRQKIDLSLLLHRLCGGEKLNGDPQIGQPTCWGCSQESLFLRNSGIHPNLSVTHERLLDVDHVRYIWSRVIHGPSVESVWCVGRVFPYMVYIDLNHHDSQI